MDFRSLYQHGFARVAACTGRVAIADPPVNAEMVLRSARECSEEGIHVAHTAIHGRIAPGEEFEPDEIAALLWRHHSKRGDFQTRLGI